MLCPWFRQRVSIALQRSLAHAIHARFLRLEDSMALLPPPMPRAPLSSSELHIVDILGNAIGSVKLILYRHGFVMLWDPYHISEYKHTIIKRMATNVQVMHEHVHQT